MLQANETHKSACIQPVGCELLALQHTRPVRHDGAVLDLRAAYDYCGREHDSVADARVVKLELLVLQGVQLPPWAVQDDVSTNAQHVPQIFTKTPVPENPICKLPTALASRLGLSGHHCDEAAQGATSPGSEIDVLQAKPMQLIVASAYYLWAAGSSPFNMQDPYNTMVP